MLRRILIGLVGLALTCVPVAAEDDPGFEELKPAVKLALDRGNLLYAYDEAAWHGTDDIRDHFPEQLKLAGGYVVTGTKTDTELVFYDKANSVAVYRATFKSGTLVSSGPPSRDRLALTPLERQLVFAMDKAMDAFAKAKVGMCAKDRPNITLLPPETEGGPIIVYLLTPRIDMKSLPLGGHYSVEVKPDGTTGTVRAFTKACAELPLSDEDGKGRPEALGITHLLDPTPTEIHVFSSLTGKIPIFVATSNGRLWRVDGSKIILAEKSIK